MLFGEREDDFPEIDLLDNHSKKTEDMSKFMAALYTEMGALQTDEAKLYKALDKLEAVIQHNESDIRSWARLF